MRQGITAVVLAAGNSRRFAGDKRMAGMPGGLTVLEQSLQNCSRAGLEIKLVLGVGDRELAEQYRRKGISTVLAEGGMGCSLAAGVKALDNSVAVLVVLADMPYIQAATLRLVAQSLEHAGIVRPVFAGQPGHPVAFSRHYFSQLMSLTADVGAREVLQRNHSAVYELPVDDAGVIRDIDYPGDIVSAGSL